MMSMIKLKKQKMNRVLESASAATSIMELKREE